MTQEAAPSAPGASRGTGDGARGERVLKLDEIDDAFAAFQALRTTDEAGANAVLEQLGADSELDRQIILELSSRSPLGHPNRFEEAHALVVRSLEVLDRNGARRIRVGPGPLRPVASYLVTMVTRFLVRSYLRSVIDALHGLYLRREANCLPEDVALPMLRRARVHAERLRPGLSKNPVALPTFLLGGAFISSGTSALQSLRGFTGWPWWSRVLILLVAAYIFYSAAWVVLRGAAIARRRIRLTVEPQLVALWQTVGRCGDPPKDQARQFALYAILLMVLAGLVLPSVVFAFV